MQRLACLGQGWPPGVALGERNSCRSERDEKAISPKFKMQSQDLENHAQAIVTHVIVVHFILCELRKLHILSSKIPTQEQRGTAHTETTAADNA